VVGVEGQPVVNAVAVAARHREDVVAFAVSVVHNYVEHRHTTQCRGVLVDEGDGAISFVAAVQYGAPAAIRHGFRRHQVDRALVGVEVLPQLHHANTHWSVAQPRAGNNVPAERFGDEVGSGFAAGKVAVGKIPQRLLSGDGFVDNRHAVDAAEERCIGRRCDPTREFELTLTQLTRVEIDVRHRQTPSGREQVCPSSSMG
jgi:hypothetical protein